MADAERAVVYVDSASDLTSLSKTSAPASSTSASANGSGSAARRILPKLQDKNNYVIKIQIGEETVYNPVRIEVSTGKNCSRGGLGKSTLMGEESPLNSSGQSSPRSDMTPPPRINTGAIRFGSETSESDTESDVSAEYRPACPTAQFAMREMLEMEPIRSMTMTKSTLNKSLSYISTPTQDIPLRAHFKEIRDRDLSPSSTSSSNSRNGLDSNNGNNRHHPLKQTLSLCPTSLPGSSGNGNGLTASFGSLSNNNEIESISMGPSRLSLLNSRSSRMSRFLEDSSKSKQDSIRPVIMDENGFHLNEMSDINGKMMNEKKESLSNFAGYKDIFARAKKDGPSQIMSDKGTIRGVKNRVRDGIATFLQSKDTKTYSEKEQGRVVVYVTSMGVVRDTFQRCQKVKQILRTLMVKFDERDCYMNRSIQSEIRQRLPPRANNQNQNQHSTGTGTGIGSSNINTLNQQSQNQSHLNQIQIQQNQATTPSSKHQHQCTNDHIALPQVFLEGQHLGDAEAIEKLNETGELRDLLRPYKSLSVLSTCDRCGGFRVLPCPICNGSKKSVHRNHFTTEFVALKCMHCDPSGLVKCEICNVADA